MTAQFKPIGMLKDYIDGADEVEVKTGCTVREALKDLGIPPEIVALVLVGETQQTKDYCLQDGDVVRLIAIIGGG